MAVYTHVSREALGTFLTAYDLGALRDFAGVEQGVENTNYIVRTEQGKVVLTLFEKRTAEADLPFFAGAMAHMAARGVPAPSPVADRTGAVFSRLCGRPAALFTFLEGLQRMAPSVADCRQMGELNARLHLAATGFAPVRANALSLPGWRVLAEKCRARADEAAPGLGSLIDEELAFLAAHWPSALPQGLIHADLFPDNVFFAGDRISGVIDFYFACTDFFIYDLSLTLNAWAAAGAPFDPGRARALIEGYDCVRPLSAAEKAALPVCLRGASLRILLTRLHDFIHRVEGAIVRVKDPLEYRDLLLFHRGGGAANLFGQS
ncbi:MAG: homoserine kinase [Parvularculaceae bacterium]